MYPQDYYFSDFIALLVEINTELTKISERYSYDPKDLFKKVKVVMMASFNEFDRGDALQRRYCKLAEILGEDGDENQSVNDKRFCKDFSYFTSTISRYESKIREAQGCTRAPKDANLTVQLPRTATPSSKRDRISHDGHALYTEHAFAHDTATTCKSI